jgi:hypothetical protein
MNIFHFFILLASIVLLLVVVLEMKGTAELLKNSKIRKIEFDKKYEIYLQEEQDPRRIYNYFTETNEKLPENLHNMMLGFALGNDYYAKMYLKELKLSKEELKSRRCGCRKKVSK